MQSWLDTLWASYVLLFYFLHMYISSPFINKNLTQ
jgi:hypothetical protein